MSPFGEPYPHAHLCQVSSQKRAAEFESAHTADSSYCFPSSSESWSACVSLETKKHIERPPYGPLLGLHRFQDPPLPRNGSEQGKGGKDLREEREKIWGKKGQQGKGGKDLREEKGEALRGGKALGGKGWEGSQKGKGGRDLREEKGDDLERP